MPKLTSYIKAILPISNTKGRYGRFEDLRSISPRDQHEIHTQIIPRVGANNWQVNQTDYQALQMLYECHDLVHSCIDLVSSQFALAKLKVRKLDLKTKKYTYATDHPLQIVLDNPNSTMMGFDLRQAYIVHRLLYGTMASILVRNSMTGSNLEVNRCPQCNNLERGENCAHILWHFHTGVVTQIMPVHPDRLSEEVIDTPHGKRSYHVYDFGNGKKSLVHPNNLITDPKYNPGGSFYGSSPTQKVQRWLEIDLGLSRQIGAYLVNNAIPSMILNLKPPKMGEGARTEDPTTMLTQMKEKWMKDFSVGGSEDGHGKNVKTPAFVYGDLQLLKIQDGIKDIVQKDLFYEIQDRVIRAYKVPRAFFQSGIEHGIVVEADNQNFFNYAIQPELESFKGKIERYVLPSYEDPTLSLEWDLSSMGIAAFKEKARRADTLMIWQVGLDNRDSVREKLGMNPIGTDLGDDLYRTDVLGTPQNSITSTSPDDNMRKPNPQIVADAHGE